MSYKSIFITNPCKIHIKNDNLIVTVEDEDNLVALDSIASIVIETQRATLTTYAISKLAEEGIAVLYVDKKYNLNAITLPFHTHSTFSKIVHSQIAISKPLKKQLWQELVKAKIKNQADVLNYFNREKSSKILFEYVKSVRSNDEENIEAKAAKIYWGELFDNFLRVQKGADDVRNASLNYCYAIVRSAVSRSLTNAGLMPAFGVHHQNYFNAFNLADDMIEPFRAFVDLHVKLTLLKFDDEVLTSKIKAEYVNILNLEYAEIDGGVSNIRTAVDVSVQSLQKCILKKDISFLKMPTIDFEKYEDECV
jgi:CRISPR-associated endonuclease Cas1 subtype II